MAKRGAGVTAVARRGELVDRFAGEERLFRLELGHLEQVEAATGRGIFAVFDRAFSGTWTLGEVRAVLTHGLIGGGETPKAAAELVDEAVTAETVLEAQVIARGVLGVALMPDLAPGAKRPKSKKNRRAPRTGSRSGS